MSDEFEKELQQQISQLQKDRLPERDLWPGIEMAVMAKKHRQTPWIAIAASVVVCVLGGLIALNKHPYSNDQTLQVVAQLDALHQREMSALKIAFKDTQPLTSNWNEQLQGMDQAAEAIKKALRNDPENVTLLKMLSDLYQKEIDLLKAVHESSPKTPYLI